MESIVLSLIVGLVVGAGLAYVFSGPAEASSDAQRQASNEIAALNAGVRKAGALVRSLARRVVELDPGPTTMDLARAGKAIPFVYYFDPSKPGHPDPALRFSTAREIRWGLNEDGADGMVFAMLFHLASNREPAIRVVAYRLTLMGNYFGWPGEGRSYSLSDLLGTTYPPGTYPLSIPISNTDVGRANDGVDPGTSLKFDFYQALPADLEAYFSPQGTVATRKTGTYDNTGYDQTLSLRLLGRHALELGTDDPSGNLVPALFVDSGTPDSEGVTFVLRRG
jgi:hypothetical protein